MRRLASIIIAGAVIAAVAGYLFFAGSQVVVTQPSTSSSVVSSSTGSPTYTAPASLTYYVKFIQQGACSPTVYVSPWSVKLDGTAANGTAISLYEQLPAQTPTPIQNGSYTAGPGSANQVITFPSVPDGAYHFVISPYGALGPSSGTFVVNGTDVLEQLDGPNVSCVTASQ